MENSERSVLEKINIPYNKVHGANMGPTWLLLAPDGPHVGPLLSGMVNFVVLPVRADVINRCLGISSHSEDGNFFEMTAYLFQCGYIFN